MLVSVDPGKNIGVATFDKEGKDYSKKIMSHSDFKLYLSGLYDLMKRNTESKVTFLYEDFNLRQDMAIAQTGSDMPASQVIGMIELMAFMLGKQATIHHCSPRNIITALKWAGRSDIALKMQRNRNYHPADDIVAHAHGVMWLINNNMRTHPIFES